MVAETKILVVEKVREIFSLCDIEGRPVALAFNVKCSVFRDFKCYLKDFGWNNKTVSSAIY